MLALEWASEAACTHADARLDPSIDRPIEGAAPSAVYAQPTQLTDAVGTGGLRQGDFYNAVEGTNSEVPSASAKFERTTPEPLTHPPTPALAS